uniref:Uncharacterized protein n=1 Tax=Glossina pallidipes TaxID=7398 RepID=A0A1A9ZME5_GLOPL
MESYVAFVYGFVVHFSNNITSEKLGGNGSNDDDDDEDDAGGVMVVIVMMCVIITAIFLCMCLYTYVLSAYVMCPQISKNEKRNVVCSFSSLHLPDISSLCSSSCISSSLNLFGSNIFSTENAKRFADSLSLAVVADEVGEAFAQFVAESGTERVVGDDVGADVVVEIDDGFAWRVEM